MGEPSQTYTMCIRGFYDNVLHKFTFDIRNQCNLPPDTDELVPP